MREDWLLITPSVLIAYLQLTYLWKPLPEYSDKDTEIPGIYTKEDKLILEFFRYALIGLFIIQWAYNIFPLTSGVGRLFLLIIGYILIIIGVVISSESLSVLKNNWTGMDDYRIKKGQTLVTNGIYAKVRHPIYLAVLLEITGYELVVNSWLAPIVAITVFIFLISHIEKEDKLLKKKFGNEFILYKSKVSRLIPGIY